MNRFLEFYYDRSSGISVDVWSVEECGVFVTVYKMLHSCPIALFPSKNSDDFSHFPAIFVNY